MILDRCMKALINTGWSLYYNSISVVCCVYIYMYSIKESLSSLYHIRARSKSQRRGCSSVVNIDNSNEIIESIASTL